MRVSQSLDSYGKYDMNAFGIEFFSLKQGKLAFDLGVLGRDLRDVVVVDLSKDKVHGSGANTILIKSFVDDADDEELVKLGRLLLCMSNLFRFEQ